MLRFFTFVAAMGAAMFMGGIAHAVPGQEFATRAEGNHQAFAYRWRDAEGTLQTLQFSLNLEDIRLGSNEFTSWDEAASRREAIAAVRSAARQFETSATRVTVMEAPKGMRVQIETTRLRRMDGAETPQPTRSPQEEAAEIDATLQDAYRKALVDYGTEHYYLVRMAGAEKVTIQPDHTRLAQRYTAAMGPVAKAIAEKTGTRDPRALINFTLNWLQHIPYDTLRDRATSNGAGFQTPYGLLLTNKGDCDTKTTALAAILRNAYPQLPLTIIYTPNHAFLGVGVPQGRRDYALSVAGKPYVLADPTGPGEAPLGQVGEDTRAQLAAGKTTTTAPIR